jgi:hypothetical protein
VLRELQTAHFFPVLEKRPSSTRWISVLTAEVYEESTVRSQIIDQLGQGTTVDFIESSGDWSLVHIDGPPEKGWIRSRELSETPVEYLTIGERLDREAEMRKQSRERMTQHRRRSSSSVTLGYRRGLKRPFNKGGY